MFVSMLGALTAMSIQLVAHAAHGSFDPPSPALVAYSSDFPIAVVVVGAFATGAMCGISVMAFLPRCGACCRRLMCSEEPPSIDCDLNYMGEQSEHLDDQSEHLDEQSEEEEDGGRTYIIGSVLEAALRSSASASATFVCHRHVLKNRSRMRNFRLCRKGCKHCSTLKQS